MYFALSAVSQNIRECQFTLTSYGRASGICYIVVEGMNAFKIALDKNGKTMGKRYVERKHFASQHALLL